MTELEQIIDYCENECIGIDINEYSDGLTVVTGHIMSQACVEWRFDANGKLIEQNNFGY